MAHDVFLCHSSADKIVADAACAALESQGIRCWIAPRDVVPGAVWAESINEAIKASRMMVLIYSERANHSHQIVRELERAVSSGLTILPFRIEDAAPSGAIEFFIGTCHWLDALTEPLAEHLEKLCVSAKANLGGSVRTPIIFGSPRGPKPDAATEQDGYKAAVRAKSLARHFRKRLDETGMQLAERSRVAGSRKESVLLERVKAFHQEILTTPEVFDIDINVESGDTMIRDRQWREALAVFNSAAAALERLIQRVEVEEQRLRAQARSDELSRFFNSRRVEGTTWDSACRTLEVAEKDLEKGDYAGAQAGFERARTTFSDAAENFVKTAADEATAKAAQVADYLAAHSLGKTHAYADAMRKIDSGQYWLGHDTVESAVPDLDGARRILNDILRGCETALEAESNARKSEQEALDYCAGAGLAKRRAQEDGARNLTSGRMSLQHGDYHGAMSTFKTAESDFVTAINEMRVLLEHKRSAEEQAQAARVKKAEMERLLSDEGLPADAVFLRLSEDLETAERQVKEEDFTGAVKRFDQIAPALARALEDTVNLVSAKRQAELAAREAQAAAELAAREAQASAAQVAGVAAAEKGKVDLSFFSQKTSPDQNYSDAMHLLEAAQKQLNEQGYAAALQGFQTATKAFDCALKSAAERNASRGAALDFSKRALLSKGETEGLIANFRLSTGPEYSHAIQKLEAAKVLLRRESFQKAAQEFEGAAREFEQVHKTLTKELETLRQRVNEAEVKVRRLLDLWCQTWTGAACEEWRSCLEEAVTLKATGALIKAETVFTRVCASLEADLQRGCRVPKGWEATDAMPIAGWATRVRDPETGIEFRFVSSGSFQMGTEAGSQHSKRNSVPQPQSASRSGFFSRLWSKSPEEDDKATTQDVAQESEFERPDENPQHTVRITQPFYLAVTPTTRSQYGQALAKQLGLRIADLHTDKSRKLAKRAGHTGQLALSCLTDRQNAPVTQLTWHEADVFCNEHGCRLPTEAEWEFACRAGETGSPEPLSSIAWHSEFSGRPTPHPVAKKEPNAWGLYDMLGNVWEWCADTYSTTAYTEQQRIDPLVTGPSNNTFSLKVARGGSWCSPVGTVRSAYRKPFAAEMSAKDLGFRCLKEI